MRDIFFSEAAWRLIPIFTSLIASFGLICALMLLGIAKRNHILHLEDSLRPVADFIHDRAVALCLLVAIPVFAGILFSIAWLDVPPNQGRYVAVWVNHYLVGLGSLIATWLTATSLRARLRLE